MKRNPTIGGLFSLGFVPGSTYNYNWAYQFLAMPKLVVLKLDDNSIAGVRIAVEIGEEGKRPTVEMQASLPPQPEIVELYNDWQSAYRSLADFRIKPIEITISGTRTQQLADCRLLREELSQQINSWLNSESFRKLQEKLLKQLMPSDTIRVLIQTDDIVLRRLPWYCWDIFDRYPKAEIALSPKAYIKPPISDPPKSPLKRGTLSEFSPLFKGGWGGSPGWEIHPINCVRILAILGNSQEIDINQDRTLLEGLPSAEVTF